MQTQSKRCPLLAGYKQDFVLKRQICKERTCENHPIPKLPWARVSALMCELNGRTYLIVVNCYSSFIEIDQLQSTTSQSVITHCKSPFACHGIPDVLITDNGPQLSSDAFRAFTHDYQIKHHTSSPHYSQSNGFAVKQQKLNQESYIPMSVLTSTWH